MVGKRIAFRAAIGTVAIRMIAVGTLAMGTLAMATVVPVPWMGIPQALAGTSQYAGGDGSPSHPYQIATLQELENMDSNLFHGVDPSTTCYELTANIDMTNAQWQPIPGFAGTFNGNGFALQNMSLFTTNHNTALFKSTTSSAMIENLILQNVSVAGNDYQTTAALVSNNAGTIDAVGVAGGAVNGGGYTANGGLVANNTGTIENSYSNAAMIGQSVSNNGGLVGINTGIIKDSYNAGSVTSGFGLVGNNSGSVVDSYYNVDVAAWSGAGSALHASQMTQQISFQNWDFSLIWGLSPTVNLGYPYLRIPAPVNLTVQGQTSSAVNIAWSAVPAASTYQVSLNGNILSANGSSPTYALSNLAPGQSYTVAITGVAADGRIGTPALLTVSIPVAPGSVTHTNVGPNGWTENWAPVSGATSYDVYLNQAKVGTVTNAVYNFTGEQLGTTYQVTVAAMNSLGLVSAPSTADTVTTAYSSSSIPTGLSHTNVTTSGWHETWNAVSDPQAGTVTYAVYLNGKSVATASTPSYDFTGEQPGTTYQVTVAAVNRLGQVGTQSNADTVTTMQPYHPYHPLSVATVSAWGGQYGVPYHALELQAVYGAGTYTWSLVSGQLPQGLQLAADGVISGTPTAPDGTYTFTVQVTAANGMARRPLSIAITGAPSLAVTRTALAADTVGRAYSAQLQGTGVEPLHWSVISGQLPKGLSLGAGGLLAGSPTEAGQFAFTVQVTDASGSHVTQPFVMDVVKPKAGERVILYGDSAWVVPAFVSHNTTYMPIWYVMQALHGFGIRSSWEGADWRLTTTTAGQAGAAGVGQPGASGSSGSGQQGASSVTGSAQSVGRGNIAIYLDGRLVMRVNGEAAADPSTHKATTYMPIWYVMQILKSMGLTSTWDGTTWTVSK
jgi:hypothetical protein